MKLEKETKPTHKLKKYQVALIVVLASIFVIATIILVVMFANNIFTENVLIICLIVLFIAMGVVGFLTFQRLSGD